jgi:hypothetical protein
MMTIPSNTQQPPQSEPPRWPSVSIVLAATHTALTCTSLFVQHTLETWRLQAVLDQVEAAALQLVRNAVESTGTMDEHLDFKRVGYLNTIVVCLRQVEAAVVVEVSDSSLEPPNRPPPAGHRSGFLILDRGKVVWTAVAYPLSKRTPSSFRYPPASHEMAQQPRRYANDHETIQRVRDALYDL